MNNIIEDRNVAVNISAKDWREAIREAGALLVQSGCIDLAYIERMINAVEELGPYMVILPGLALAHAAPGPDVYKDAISLATLREPVKFNSAENDPVRVVLCLSCKDRESHIASLRRVATLLMEEDMVERLANAKTKEEILNLLQSE
ncbi:MAG: Ascorbate-specific phosphotransferase enzyme IIA component [Firmicutes bacterium ADurb.Bin182]|nr:MAG: Ascorbate-specific phosphotransferase enzyme IIA component [Firmicutes bacterium ADurb.Bin182]